jgi:hypothetical protein
MDACKRKPTKAWTPAENDSKISDVMHQKLGYHRKDASKSINASRKRQQNLGRHQKLRHHRKNARKSIDAQQKHKRQRKDASKSMDASKRTSAKAWMPTKEHQQKHGRQQKNTSKSIDVSKMTANAQGRQKSMGPLRART